MLPLGYRSVLPRVSRRLARIVEAAEPTEETRVGFCELRKWHLFYEGILADAFHRIGDRPKHRLSGLLQQVPMVLNKFQTMPEDLDDEAVFSSWQIEKAGGCTEKKNDPVHVRATPRYSQLQENCD